VNAILDQIDANTRYITALGQEYDGAILQLQKAQQALSDARDRDAALTDSIHQLLAAINRDAASDYRAGTAGQSLQGLDLPAAQQLGTRNHYATVLAAKRQARLRDLEAQQRGLLVSENSSRQAQQDADTDAKAVDTTRQRLEAANAQRAAILSQVTGSIAALLPDAERARLARTLAAALAQFAPGSAGGGDPSLYPNLPPVSPAAAIAIAYARAQLGKPYVYAAAGPDAFDCSGLVMAAFAYAGVQLPHYSGAQYDLLPHVPLLAVQPGDLLFWGPGGSEHVAIYVGAGRILEAGGTGNDVHIGPIWPSPIGAARVV
jgi:cell wall-associated NlpC family hydrolase